MATAQRQPSLVMTRLHNAPVLRLLGMLIIAEVVIAASPALNLGGMRLIPAAFAVSIPAILLAFYCLVAQHSAVSKSLLATFGVLSGAAIASIFGSFETGNGLPALKLLILLYQYSFLLLAYLSAPFISLDRLGLFSGIFGAIYGVLMALQSIGIIPGADHSVILGSPLHRANLFFSQPNGSAAYLATVLPLSFLFKPPNFFWKLGIRAARLAIITGILAAFSRSALAALLFTYITLIICRSAWFGAVSRLLFGLAIVLAMFASLNKNIYELAELVTASDGALQGDASAIERYGLGTAGIQMFYENPMFGVGVGNYGKMLGAFDSTLDANLNIPHNIVISFAAEQGLVGVIALAVFIGMLFRTMSNTSIPMPLQWAAWALLINGWFGWPFIHGLGEQFMIIYGLLIYHAHRNYFQGNDGSIDTIEGGTARATFGVAPHRS